MEDKVRNSELIQKILDEMGIKYGVNEDNPNFIIVYFSMSLSEEMGMCRVMFFVMDEGIVRFEATLGEEEEMSTEEYLEMLMNCNSLNNMLSFTKCTIDEDNALRISYAWYAQDGENFKHTVNLIMISLYEILAPKEEEFALFEEEDE